MQTTLLGLAIAFIIALIAALVGPYFIDWNQFRPQFETEATRVLGVPVRVGGALDARLLPTPSLRLRSVVVGGANDLGKVRADKLDVEFSLGSLMRGEWRANELTINGLSLDLGLDPQGRIDWPVAVGKLNLGSLSIDRLNLTGRIALHDAASHETLELNDIAFSGDVRSLAGAVRGDGNFMLSGTRYPFRISSGQSVDGEGTRIYSTSTPARARCRPTSKACSASRRGRRASKVSRPCRFRLRRRRKAPTRGQRRGGYRPRSRPIRSPRGSNNSRRATAPTTRALKFTGLGDIRFGASPQLHAVLAARQLDADRFFAKKTTRTTTRTRITLPSRYDCCRAARADGRAPASPDPGAHRIQFRADHAGRSPAAECGRRLVCRCEILAIDRLDFRAPGTSQRRPERRSNAAGRPAVPRARSTLNCPIRIRWWRGCRAAARSPIAVKSRCNCAAMSASARTASRSTP